MEAETLNAIEMYKKLRDQNRRRVKAYYERNKDKILAERMKEYRATHEPVAAGGRGRPRKVLTE